jgi:hypothetical protein
MNWSRSPSNTASTLLVSISVRRSFTIWYGCTRTSGSGCPSRPGPACRRSRRARPGAPPRSSRRGSLQTVHRLLPVLELAALLLGARDEPGRLVDEADGRRGLVDVLATGARRPEDLHPDVGLVDVDVRLVELGPHLDRGEARLTSALVVERADPHEAVRAALAGHEAVRVAALISELGRVDPGLGALGGVVELIVEPAPLGPLRRTSAAASRRSPGRRRRRPWR